MLDTVQNINNILQSLKIKAACVNYRKIRNVSLYDLVLEPGAKVRDIRKFSDEISLALKIKTKPIVKIMSDVGIVRLETTDDNPTKISFFDEFKRIKHMSGQIPMYLGAATDGTDVWVDMAKNPHLLVAGTTGSGKSTLLHVIMANALRLLNVKVCFIDSKNIEFSDYGSFPNCTVATNYSSAIALLKYLHGEMEHRYTLLNHNVITQNQIGDANSDFPFILLIIDEFADLIMQDDFKVFYTTLCKLTQKCRAAGIYCTIATQRPSSDIVKGAIKANFPARISCQVASHIDSKVILDSTGAELLAGQGDSIIKNYDNNFKRFQIAYTTKEQISEQFRTKNYI